MLKNCLTYWKSSIMHQICHLAMLPLRDPIRDGDMGRPGLEVNDLS